MTSVTRTVRNSSLDVGLLEERSLTKPAQGLAHEDQNKNLMQHNKTEKNIETILVLLLTSQ